MGLRVTTPRPQPSEAIPATQPRTLENLEQVPLPENQPITSAANAPENLGAAPVEQPVPAPEPAPAPGQGRVPAGEPSDADILAALEGPDADTPSDDEILGAMGFENMSEAASAIKSKLDQRGFFSKFGERFKASFGRNTEETASFLRNKFGAENVKIEDGNIKFRADKKEKFQDFDPTVIPERKDLPSGVGAAFQEMGLDIADFGGDIVEGVLSAAIELGVVSGTTLATGGAGAVPAFAAGAAISGAVGPQARAEALEAFGGTRDVNIDEVDLSIGAAGLNVAMLGLGAFAKKGFNKGAEAIRAFNQQRPIKVIEQVAVINKSVDDFVREQAIPVDPKVAATEVFGALDKIEKNLSSEVGVFIEDAIEATKGQRFVPENYLRETVKVFQDARVVVDPNTLKANIGPGTLTLGSPNGKQALKGIVDQFNEIMDKTRAGGGLDLREMDDLKKSMFSLKQAWSKGAQNLPKDKRIAAVVGKIHGGMATDRVSQIKTALKDTVDGKSIDDAIGNFAESADDLKEFKKLFSRADSAEIAGDALIKKGNSERVIKLKNILGEESPEWKQFRATWLNQRMEDATSLTTGIFDAKQFIESISDKRLGKEVRSQLMTDGDFRRMQKAATDFDRLGVTDINNSPKGQLAVEAMVSLISPFRNAQVRGGWALARGNASAADYLLDRGFVKMAEDAASVAEKREFLGARELLRTLVNNSRKVTKGGKEFYITTPAVRNILRAGIGDEQQEVGKFFTGLQGSEEETEGAQQEPGGFQSTGDADIDAILQEGLQ